MSKVSLIILKIQFFNHFYQLSFENIKQYQFKQCSKNFNLQRILPNAKAYSLKIVPIVPRNKC